MRFLTLLFVLLLAVSCSIQKRHYRPGFFLQKYKKETRTALVSPETKTKDSAFYLNSMAAVPNGIVLPVLYVADTAVVVHTEMVNEVLHDTLLPDKKLKKKTVPLPGETPDETDTRAQHKREGWYSFFMITGGLLLALFFGFELGAITTMTGLIIAIIGLMIMLIALISIARAKARLRRREKGLPERERRKGFTIRKTLLVTGISAIIASLTFFVVLNNLNSVWFMLIFLTFPALIVFLAYLLILIGLLIARFIRKKRAKNENKPVAENQPLTPRQKYFIQAMTALGFLAAGILLLFLGGQMGILVIIISAGVAIYNFVKLFVLKKPKKKPDSQTASTDLFPLNFGPPKGQA